MAYIGQKPGSNFRDVSIKDSFTGDGSTVAFDLAKSFSQADVNGIEVFVDNVRQEPTVAYTVGQDDSGNFKRVTFTAAPAASASIYVLNPGVTSGVLTVSDASVTSSKLSADAITGQTELAEAANNADTVLLHDTSASALKKIQVSNLTAQAGDGLSKTSSTIAVDINGTTLLNEGSAGGDFAFIYDASAGVLRKITVTNFLNFPTISSVSPTNATSGDGTGNYTFVITGSGFTGATASLVASTGASVSFASQSVDSNTQITGVIAKSTLTNAGEPYDVKVVNSAGLSTTLDNQINVDAQPVWQTAAGLLTTVADSGRSGFSAITLSAHDPESGADPTYTLESGSLPSGLSGASTSSGYVISGTPNAVGSNTTSTFTIRAKDAASNTSDRQYQITVLAPASQSFTSSGTFSVPSGISAVDVLVVGGGGSGGNHHGAGGGAGGLIYRPAFPVTPGGTVTVTVGDGGAARANFPAPDNTSGLAGETGQDSVFGTLTAKGGGAGGGYPNSGNGGQGGSGGGEAGPGQNGSAGTATQPTQSGESGNYGFGNPGGSAPTLNNAAGGGGGGAGGAGDGPSTTGGAGGVGKAYTIADGTTSVYYAGGGGGSFYSFDNGTRGVGGQGGGGNGGRRCESPSTGHCKPATANRGGGGGGADRGPGSGGTSGAGGKGIVIVRY